jgi:hypothetical protein
MTAFCGATAAGEPAMLRSEFQQYAALLTEATAWIADVSPMDAATVATPYLRMFGIVLAAYLLLRQAAVAQMRLVSGAGDVDFLSAKVATARFFVDNILPQVTGIYTAVMQGNVSRLFALSEAQLCA